jgi:acetyltransferase-like isoleucine patch superfamily enzyme
LDNELAPIVLFVYNRLDHTRQTIEALQKNELANESELFIYSDAAKNEDEKPKIDAVRKYIKTINSFKKVTIIERDKNWGLANSIIDGVTKIVNEYGKIIVLEDDLVTSTYFLKFMNEALEKYKHEDDVFSITGYSFTDDIVDMDSTYFLSITSSWSWATWAGKWKYFERNKEKLKQFIKDKSNHKKFNFDNSYNFISMAKDNLLGKNDSWAIHWYFSVFQKNGLTLYPSKSLVANVGFDGSGTNCGLTTNDDANLSSFMPTFTEEISEKEANRKIVSNILLFQKNSLIFRLAHKFKTILKSKLSPKHKIQLVQLKHKIKLFLLKKQIGNNTYIDKTVHVTGWNSISIGKNTAISEYTWINVNNRTPNHKHITIGDNCYIGRRNFFSSGWLIEIGDYVMTGINCKFIGSDHIFTNPYMPYITTGTTNDKIIKVGSNVWLGVEVTVMGNVTIGHGTIIGAGSLVNKDIPPFSIAVGNPCKVIKRFDFKLNEWKKIDEYNPSHDTYMPTKESYLEILKMNSPHVTIPLQACSRDFGDMF